MKIMTSYFYAIRFFKPNMIPISTAKWDPAWYHQQKGPSHYWVDKNEVMNGLRAEVFAPGPITEAFHCSASCNKDSESCSFLQAYNIQLAHLDINDILTRTERLCEQVRTVTHYEGEPIAVFIVHEAPDNKCSERTSIQNYFKNNGIECEEYQW